MSLFSRLSVETTSTVTSHRHPRKKVLTKKKVPRVSDREIEREGGRKGEREREGGREGINSMITCTCFFSLSEHVYEYNDHINNVRCFHGHFNSHTQHG